MVGPGMYNTTADDLVDLVACLCLGSASMTTAMASVVPPKVPTG